MKSADFWASINTIIDDGFTHDGLQKLDRYAEQFISGELIYQRFSPLEQYGCTKGGETHVIASLLASAKNGTNRAYQGSFPSFKDELECSAQQAQCIEAWSRAVGCWINNVTDTLTHEMGEHIAQGGEALVFEHGESLIKSIGLDYYLQPLLALDRISLHNAYFPETSLTVLGFGRDENNEFKIIVKQPFIIGDFLSEKEISQFMQKMGFDLKNPRNWTYATPEIYLSDLHDENVIKSEEGHIFVIDCDIRLNTPDLKTDGTRQPSKKVVFVKTVE